jgi:hypothetical protein
MGKGKFSTKNKHIDVTLLFYHISKSTSHWQYSGTIFSIKGHFLAALLCRLGPGWWHYIFRNTSLCVHMYMLCVLVHRQISFKSQGVWLHIYFAEVYSYMLLITEVLTHLVSSVHCVQPAYTQLPLLLK